MLNLGRSYGLLGIMYCVPAVMMHQGSGTLLQKNGHRTSASDLDGMTSSLLVG